LSALLEHDTFGGKIVFLEIYKLTQKEEMFLGEVEV
jgi:hypothetical protein